VLVDRGASRLIKKLSGLRVEGFTVCCVTVT
jgi:hypothetical protein